VLPFTAADHVRVAAGEITVTWRLWKYAHVKPDRIYSTGFGAVEIEDVRVVRAADVSDADARECGLADAASLIEMARSHTGAIVEPDTLLYRVQFHYVADPPSRPQLRLFEISSRLERLDQRSPRGPWTQRVLRLIEDEPGVPARALAAEAGRATPDFKADVRRLKALGLTISLEVGYELSELGQAYVDSLDWQAVTTDA
jgi:hypothetical protein